MLPIQFVGPIRHALDGCARPIAEDAEVAAAFFSNRTAFVDAYAKVRPQPDFDLATFWREQDILDFWLTVAHHVSPHPFVFMVYSSVGRQKTDDFEYDVNPLSVFG